MPAHVAAHVLLAQAYMEQERWDEAIRAWQNASFFMPNSPTIQEGIRRVLKILALQSKPEAQRSESDTEADGGTDRSTTDLSTAGTDLPNSLSVDSLPEDLPPAEHSAAPFSEREPQQPADEPPESSVTDQDIGQYDLDHETPVLRVNPSIHPDVDPAVNDSASAPTPHLEETSASTRDEPEADTSENKTNGNAITADNTAAEEEGQQDVPANRKSKHSIPEPTPSPAPPGELNGIKIPPVLAPYAALMSEWKEDNELDHLIQELESARIVPKPEHEPIESPALDSDIGDIVSETLARIYERQKQYDEAADMYEKLARMYPERAGEFQEKASELRSREDEHSD